MKTFLAFGTLLLIITASPASSVTPLKCDTNSTGSYTPGSNYTRDDANLILFALNLEYLEAELFLWSAYGYGLDKIAPDLTGNGPEPIGVEKANLDPQTLDLTIQLGLQEVGHLRAIRETVKDLAFPRPLLNVGEDVWGSLMDNAFGTTLNPPFNPYVNALNFLIAIYAIPYVGLTGYVGANPLLTGQTAKRLVAGLLGVEAGQDAVIRTALYYKKDEVVAPYPYTVADFTDKISNLRNRLGKTGNVDEGLEVPECLGAEASVSGNVLSADANSVAYARTPQQILRVVYGTGSEYKPGGFYPKGGNGTIAQSYLHGHY
eukprot:c6616_g1_i1 orf=102-1055(+)